MPPAKIKVLYGDSTSSNLEPDVLDVVVRLVQTARDVADGFLEIANLDQQREDASEVTDQILADLDRFQRQVEVGLRGTAQDAKRPEMRKHGEDAIEVVVRMIDGWRRQYLEGLESEQGRVAARKDERLREMRAALERFILPMRQRAPERMVHRVLDGQGYRDSMTAELVPGVGLRLSCQDTEQEVPRRMRSLVGKGAKVQIGTRLTRLRKIEEPLLFSLDDHVIIEAQIEQDAARVVLAKKPGTPTTLILEFAAVGDGATARATRPEGDHFLLPPNDEPIVHTLWAALQNEAARIAASPARLVAVSLDDYEVTEAAPLLEAVERIVEVHRPIVAAIAERSPNIEELAIKLETDDGRREEAWVKRAELAQHLIGLPDDLRRRLDIGELHSGNLTTGPASLPKPAGLPMPVPDAGDNSERISLGPPGPPPPPPPPPPPRKSDGKGATDTKDDKDAAPSSDVVEDISLRDLDLLIEGLPDFGDDPVGPTKVRSRESS